MTMTALLEARHVSKVFGGGLFDSERRCRARRLLAAASTTEPPSITAVVGESGSGKTTLARLLLGLVEPTTRRGALPGQGSADALRPAERKHVPARRPGDLPGPVRGLQPVLQGRPRPGDADPEVRAGATRRREARDADRGDAARRSGCGRRRRWAAIPHQLSGGQRQRIMVARALLIRPRLIIADEPVSMVDASLRATILDSLRS